MLDEKTTTQATAPWAALLLRVGMGTMFLAHGALLKLGTFGVAGTMGYFGSIGYPPALGVVVIAAEILGGLALILGIGVRAVSLALVPLMLGALLQHAGNGWMFAGKGGGWEFPAFWTLALLAQAGLGAGALALRPGRPGLRGSAAGRPAVSVRPGKLVPNR
ncbi:DoxX family protein [Dankookia rubra]|uniref:DoxX family protein n=1 Tax=Dankookia rubra TaxID=1442381 RepID=A0A4R5Q9H7_9PROT|nr:DoxX family protein [Dankookia rubra]TDH59168.1 DoxX family protein [Dankookia rubra]